MLLFLTSVHITIIKVTATIIEKTEYDNTENAIIMVIVLAVAA
jgi:hypothetical protein